MDAPDSLQDRGKALWDALEPDDVGPQAALVLEACRIADRLDELDSIIHGKGVLNLMKFRLHESWGEDGDRTVLVRVEFQSVLSEARQQALALERLLTRLGLTAAKPKSEGEENPLARVLALVQSTAKPAGRS